MKNSKLLFSPLMTVILVLFMGSLLAQPPHKQRRDHQKHDGSRIESMKVAYITNKLDLTPEEARKFWPVYNSWQNKKEELWKDFKNTMPQEDEQINDLSDKRLNEMIEALIAKDRQKADLQRQYLTEIKNVLPLEKVAKLLQAEHNFKRHLLKRRSSHGPDNKDK